MVIWVKWSDLRKTSWPQTFQPQALDPEDDFCTGF